MHGAGREDITTTLNNCYVVAVRDDSIKSIYFSVLLKLISSVISTKVKREEIL